MFNSNGNGTNQPVRLKKENMELERINETLKQQMKRMKSQHTDEHNAKMTESHTLRNMEND